MPFGTRMGNVLPFTFAARARGGGGGDDAEGGREGVGRRDGAQGRGEDDGAGDGGGGGSIRAAVWGATKSRIPLLTAPTQWTRSSIAADVVAGCTVSVVLVPQVSCRGPIESPTPPPPPPEGVACAAVFPERTAPASPPRRRSRTQCWPGYRRSTGYTAALCRWWCTPSQPRPSTRASAPSRSSACW